MGSKIKNRDLAFLHPLGKAGLATGVRIANTLLKQRGQRRENILNHLREVMKQPQPYLEGDFADLARLVVEHAEHQPPPNPFGTLHEAPKGYRVFGREHIAEGAIDQMNMAMRLPVATAGALMPDAHVGYGLPIGGVLATVPEVVIPYAVGVDIACRMCMSIFPVDERRMQKDTPLLTKSLVEQTKFGMDGRLATPADHDILERPEWQTVPFIRSLRDKAWAQLGTSGTGNHFVEWGLLELREPLPELEAGTYLALLSHSGSRGLGATIAGHYTRLAMEQTDLPREARHLAWLDLRTETGQEYWLGMNLAGEYASACHHVIHHKLARATGLKPALMLENHHNFAWREHLPDGREVLVHRKGATPAAAGDLGIIPGSATQAGYVVRGRGLPQSLESASHGAGRQMSRGQAFQTYTLSEIRKQLEAAQVTMIGGDVDEAPMVYKDLDTVLEAQRDVVDVVARFQPKIVRMADPETKRRRKGQQSRV